MYCIELSPETDLSVNEIGGKALNLGRLMSLGIAVPSGFAFGARAFTDALADVGLIDQVRAWLEGYDPVERSRNLKTYDRLCAEIRSATIPADIRRELLPLVEKLLSTSEHGLAIRSSAIHEDSANASFAGVYESVLCVTSVDAVMAGIIDCWCSLWSPKAIDYALGMGVEVSPDAMALIIQQVVMADSAGVIFTADPMTGDPWRLVINSTFGLAEGILSGPTSADRFVLEWDTGNAIEKTIAEKAPVGTGGRTGSSSLSDRQLSDLAGLALRIDEAFGARMDIEWAITGENLYALQARPITALPEFFPYSPDETDRETTWNLLDPAWVRYPYWALSRSSRNVVAPLNSDICNTELWNRHQPTGKGTKMFPRPDQVEERAFNGYGYTVEWKWGGPWWDMIATYQWLEANEPRLRKDWDERVAAMRQFPEETRRILRELRSRRELIPAFLAMRERSVDMEAASYAAPQSMGGMCEKLLEAALTLTYSQIHVGDLLQGLPSFSYERTMAAQDLAEICCDEIQKAFRDLPIEDVLPYIEKNHPGSPFLESLREFCWAFGLVHGDTMERGNLLSYLVTIRNTITGEAKGVWEHAESCRIAREACEKHVRQVAGKDRDLLSRLNKLLPWSQYWSAALDNRQWAGAGLKCTDDLMRRVGEVLVDDGLLNTPEDVLLFTADELAEIGENVDVSEYRGLYTRRKKSVRGNRRLLPPEQLRSDPYEQKAPGHTASALDRGSPQSYQGKSLSGKGLSPGQVSGVARVVRKMDELASFSALTSNDIIVCPDPNLGYIDWFSVFMVVKGAVTTWGDMLHHVSQIARECGIVLVNLPVGDAGAIHDGQAISIDGTNGTVIRDRSTQHGVLGRIDR